MEKSENPNQLIFEFFTEQPRESGEIGGQTEQSGGYVEAEQFLLFTDTISEIENFTKEKKHE